MAGRTPFTNVDLETAADLRRRGLDPHEVDRVTERLLAYICTDLLPGPPVSDTPRRSFVIPASDGVDRISLLPDTLLSNILSRLLVKDAARTAVLASRWRRVWLSAQPVLIDAFLLPEEHRYSWPPTPANSPAITAAVSGILEAHPGPFRSVHLICSHMGAHQAQLARWLQLLAAKGVHDLVLVNRPWPCDVPLPDTLFSINTLVRLYIGLFKFPDTAGLRGASFPHLRELGICTVVMEQGDVDSIVASSPVLEILSIQGSRKGLRLRLVSQSLRCVQVCSSVMEDMTVVKAPRLERLILQASGNRVPGLVRIFDAPMLCVFGLPANHVLEIRDTTIMAGMNVSTKDIVTSVKILSLNVCFGVPDEANMVSTFLKCFPNLERLHIMSSKCDQSTGNLGLNIKEGPTESGMRHMKEMYFREFRGEQGEVSFLKWFLKSAMALETAVVLMANPSFTTFSTDMASSKLWEACGVNRPYDLLVFGSTGPEGGRAWSFRKGRDFSSEDPFSVMEIISLA